MIFNVVLIYERFFLHDMQHGEGKRCVRPWTYLKVEVGRCSGLGSHRIDNNDFSTVLTQPVLVHMRPAVCRIRSPDQNALAVSGRTGIEASNRITENVTQGRVTCGVTNGIWINLGRTDMVKKPFRKLPRNDGACSGVMGMIDSIGTVLAIDLTKPISNLCQGVVPGNSFEFAASLFS